MASEDLCGLFRRHFSRLFHWRSDPSRTNLYRRSFPYGRDRPTCARAAPARLPSGTYASEHSSKNRRHVHQTCENRRRCYWRAHCRPVPRKNHRGRLLAFLFISQWDHRTGIRRICSRRLVFQHPRSSWCRAAWCWYAP